MRDIASPIPEMKSEPGELVDSSFFSDISYHQWSSPDKPGDVVRLKKDMLKLNKKVEELNKRILDIQQAAEEEKKASEAERSALQSQQEELKLTVSQLSQEITIDR